MKKVNILGVNFSYLSKQEVLDRLERFILSGRAHLVVTPNAEFILATNHDEEFYHILNSADLSVLDGSGPQLASYIMGSPIERFPGADFVKEIFCLSEELQKKVVVVNWKAGLSTASEIKKALLNNWPQLQLEVIDVDREVSESDVQKIHELNPVVLISTLGAPFQEKFLYHQLNKIDNLRLAIGVGGALDFLTGRAKRAPRIMRVVGLEWAWRLLMQPSRFKRIWNATSVFVYKFIRWQFILPHLYRPNVACMVYKKIGDEYFVLLVERVDQKNHWQLPQGGTDGQGIALAGTREVEEELGIKKLTKVKIFKDIWRYDFPKKSHSLIMRHSGYKGQKQSLLIAEFADLEENIKINFWDHSAWKWVRAADLVDETYEVRREGYRKFLEIFNNSIQKNVEN